MLRGWAILFQVATAVPPVQIFDGFSPDWSWVSSGTCSVSSCSGGCSSPDEAKQCTTWEWTNKQSSLWRTNWNKNVYQKNNKIGKFLLFFFSTLPSSGIAPCVGTTSKWYRRHTLAMPCLAAVGLVWSWVESQLIPQMLTDGAALNYCGLGWLRPLWAILEINISLL